MSTLSPSEKGNELPFAIAAETADLRKSIVVRTWAGRSRSEVTCDRGPWGRLNGRGESIREEEECMDVASIFVTEGRCAMVVVEISWISW